MYNKVDKFKEIVDKMLDLYQRKQSDYGDSVGKTFDEYGLVSFLVRIEDKLNRVRTLNEKGRAKVTDESLMDTLYALANHAMLAIIELKEANKWI